MLPTPFRHGACIRPLGGAKQANALGEPFFDGRKISHGALLFAFTAILERMEFRRPFRRVAMRLRLALT
jgi:hypothetical protein